jgi:hypothetical protein
MGCCGSCGGQDSNQAKPPVKDETKGQEQKPAASEEKGQAQK